jgi:fluoride ion exporter CrcB/FEX
VHVVGILSEEETHLLSTFSTMRLQLDLLIQNARCMSSRILRTNTISLCGGW